MSFIEANPLLKLYSQKERHLQIIQKYGKAYYHITISSMDVICHWLLNMRAKFLSHGQSVFQTEGNSMQNGMKTLRFALPRSLENRECCDAATTCQCLANNDVVNTGAERHLPGPIPGHQSKKSLKNSSSLAISRIDVSILLNPVGWINDSIISAAQMLLKKQSHVNGFKTLILE